MAQNALANNLGNIIDPNQASDNPLATGLKSMGSDNSGTDQIFKTPDKFSYDAASDPQYQSALNLARQNIQTDQGNTLANLVSHGQGNSSYSAGAVAGVADKAMGNLNNNLLPQFIREAYNHYQDNIKNNYQTQLANYNASQDQIKNNQWNQTFGAGRTDAANNLAINKGTLTGDYTDPGMAALQKQFDDNSAAYANATPEQQAQLHDKNLAIAKQLGKTYDPTTGEYSGGNPTRTVAGQTLDSNSQQKHIDLANYLSEKYGVKVDPKNDPALAYKQVEGLTPVSALQQAFDNKIKQETVNNSATATSNAFTLGSRNADTAKQNAENSKNNANQSALYKQWETTGKAPAGIPGVTEGTPLFDKTGVRQDEALKNKQGQLDIKAFSTERDGMIGQIRSGKVALPDAMKQVNEDEQLGIYAPDLAEKMRSALRVLSKGQAIPGDTQKGPQIDLGGFGLGGGGGTSVTQSVFGR